METIQGRCALFRTNPSSSTPQNSNCTGTYFPSQKLDPQDMFISRVLWYPPYRHTNVRRLAKTYIHQLYANTGCHLEDLPIEMDYEDGWRKSISPCYQHDLMMMMMMMMVLKKQLNTIRDWLQY